MAHKKSLSWLSIFSRAAHNIGAVILWSDEFKGAGLIQFPNGRRSFFHRGILDLNTVAAARIAQDKGYTTSFLRSLDYRVPEEKTFFSAEFCERRSLPRGPVEAIAYAFELGFPVYLKPAHLSMGCEVCLVFNEEEFEAAAKAIFSIDTVLIVQRAYSGRDYRIVVIDGTVICAYERVPLTIVGDGQSDVAQLLTRIQLNFDQMERDTSLDLSDRRICANLHRKNLTMTSVVAKGERIKLHDIANLSAGGTAIDRTNELHQSFEKLAFNIASDLNLRFCGIDVLANDISELVGEHVILEVNSAPGLDNYLYQSGYRVEHIEALYTALLRKAGEADDLIGMECSTRKTPSI